MSIKEMFRVYGNRNSEVRAIANQAYEFGKNVAQSQSAALSAGIAPDEVKRQQTYIEATKKNIATANDKIQDRPQTHPNQYPIDMSIEYNQFVEDTEGNLKPINEHTALLAELWLILAVELARSQSAQISGSLLKSDRIRAEANLDEIDRWLKTFEDQDILDMPETVKGSSEYGPSDVVR